VRVLVTGHNGYIGSVLAPLVQAAGHEVVGLDSFLYKDCTFGEDLLDVPALRMDIRDIRASHLEGFDAVIHLAGISNDPLGDMNPKCTYAVNHEASVRLARLSKRVGVSRFLFSSSCSLYGVAKEEMVNEEAVFKPVTPYGKSKVLVEEDVSQLADSDFSPTFLRNGTAYGVSPRLRTDLVVNNLVGFAYTTGEALIKSDGMAWRPLVHVEDISRAFLAVLEAPRELIHNEAFNVGTTVENYRVSDVAETVTEVVCDSKVVFAKDGGHDSRCYRVDCNKLATTLPEFHPQWTLRQGVEELVEAYQHYGLTNESLVDRYQRVKHIKKLMDEQWLDLSLRWHQTVPSSPLGAENV
jgi:nucleoside-diphosphate-sugar epimerase